MNMILLLENDFICENTVLLKGRRHEHITEILKAGVGDVLRVGRINGMMGRGRVLETDREGTRMEITDERQPPAKIPITVIAALPRPPVFRRVVAALTAMGVDEMAFIQTARVEKSYWNSPSLRDKAVEEAMALGLEQAHDTIVPRILFSKRFKPFAEDALPGMIRGRKALVAHPQRAVACPSGVKGGVILAVGPEGGFTDHEVDLLSQTGFQPVHLGPRILRVETAIQAFVGRLIALD